MLFRLGDPVELLPTVAGAVGEACMVLEAAVVALGVGVGGGLVVGVVAALPIIVTVMWELESQRDCADQALCFTVGGVAAVLSTVLEGVSSWPCYSLPFFPFRISWHHPLYHPCQRIPPGWPLRSWTHSWRMFSCPWLLCCCCLVGADGGGDGGGGGGPVGGVGGGGDAVQVGRPTGAVAYGSWGCG